MWCKSMQECTVMVELGNEIAAMEDQRKQTLDKSFVTYQFV